MPYNLFLLPLTAGYFFLVTFVFFKYKYQRLSSERLLFSSIIAGIVIIAITFTIRGFLDFLFPHCISFLYRNLYAFFPIREEPYLWTSVFCFTIITMSTLLANLLIIKKYGKSFIVAKAIDEEGDEVEQLFKTSAVTGELMQITLQNNKVYIGFTDILSEPKKTNYLKITPVLSGYRNSETKELQITTEYFEVLEIFTSECPKFDIYDIDISIKQDEIISASIYDQKVYDLFNPDLKVKKKKKKKSKKK